MRRPTPRNFSLKDDAPDFGKQPILVIEVPRELVNKKTRSKYFGQKRSTLDLDLVIAPDRWKFIGKFLLVYTNQEQVRYLLYCPLSSHPFPHPIFESFIIGILCFPT